MNELIDKYLTIQGWMLDLGLSNNELMCFAVINGFSQDDESMMKGGLSYLQKWLNVSRPTVISILKKLLDKGYIERTEVILKDGKHVFYRVVKNFNQGRLNILTKVGKETLPSNNNREIYKGKEEKRISNDIPKNTRFVKPTVEQVEAYCKEKKYDLDAQYFIDYYDARGWMLGKNHIKDWKACIRTWMRKSKENNNKEYSASDEQQPSEPSQVEQLYNRFLAWADKNIPAIKDAVTLEIFKEMRVDVNFNGSVFAAILKKIELTGDIDRILHEDGYLWSEFTRIRTEIYNDL